MDSQMGRILTELEDLELASNTVVSSIIINIKIIIKTTSMTIIAIPSRLLSLEIMGSSLESTGNTRSGTTLKFLTGFEQ